MSVGLSVRHTRAGLLLACLLACCGGAQVLVTLIGSARMRQACALVAGMGWCYVLLAGLVPLSAGIAFWLMLVNWSFIAVRIARRARG